MTQHATSDVQTTGWDEKTWDGADYSQVDGHKQTVAIVRQTFAGDVTAEADVRYLMSYTGDVAHYVGLAKLTGRIGDREGSFVLQFVGDFKDNVATATCDIVPDSGTGQLAGLRGSGKFVSEHNGKTTLTLDYAV